MEQYDYYTLNNMKYILKLFKKCGYYISPFSKKFFIDVLKGKKKLLKIKEVKFWKGKFPRSR